jgi:hypothetical protein
MANRKTADSAGVKYTGILATPREPDPPPNLLADDATQTKWIERQTAETTKRLLALFETYGVELNNPFELIRRLAEAHVPGFKMRSRSGPKPVWDEWTKAELRLAIKDYVVKQSNMGKRVSITQACGALSKIQPWTSKLRGKNKNRVQALRGHYNTADIRLVHMMRDLREYERIKALSPP